MSAKINIINHTAKINHYFLSFCRTKLLSLLLF